MQLLRHSGLYVFIFVHVAAFAAEAPPKTTPPFLRELVREALSSHPSVEAAKARADAATSAIDAVRLWQDPRVAFSVIPAQRMMREFNGDLFVGIDQMLPRPRLYEAEKRKAEADQKVRAASREITANQLGRSVAQGALELALADELIRIQEEDYTLVETMMRAAQERAKNPDANASDSLRLESELAARNQTLGAARRTRTQLATNLNLLLGRPPATPWRSLALPESPPALPLADSLLATVEKGNPNLGAMRHEIAGSAAETDMARAERRPMVSMGVGTNIYSGGDVRDGMLNLSVNLPWFNRSVYDANISRAESMRDATADDLAAEHRRLHSEATAMLTEAENNRQIARSYAEDVIPKAEQALEAIRNAWVSSRATLVEVLDSRRSLLMARQERERALAASHVAAQNLAALTGDFSNL